MAAVLEAITQDDFTVQGLVANKRIDQNRLFIQIQKALLFLLHCIFDARNPQRNLLSADVLVDLSPEAS